MVKQYYFKKPSTNEVYGFSADEISKNPQLMNCLVRISDIEMRKLTGIGSISLEVAKEKQLKKIKDKFTAMLNDTQAALVVPGVGQVDATRTDLENVNVLIDDLEAAGEDKSLFRLHDNSFVEVNLEQLRNIKRIIGRRGIEIHNRKWELEKAIFDATTIPEVEAVNW